MGQIAKGRIAIYTEGHKLLEQKLYYTSKGMKKIMSDFMQDYKQEASYIQVRPYAEDEQGKPRKKIIRLHVVTEPKTFVRPPAIYDNQRSAYGL